MCVCMFRLPSYGQRLLSLWVTSIHLPRALETHFGDEQTLPIVNITGGIPGQGKRDVPKLSLLLCGHSSFCSLLSSSPPASLRTLWPLFLRLPFHCLISPRLCPQGTALLSLSLFCDAPHSHGFKNQVRAHVSQISFPFPAFSYVPTYEKVPPGSPTVISNSKNSCL